MRKRGSTKLVLTLAGAAAALALAACGEKDEPDLASLPPASTTAPTTTTTQPDPAPGGDGEEPGRGGALERQAEHTVEAYITWLDRGQGGRLCKLIDERTLENLRLPVRRGGCGPALSASIGYRNPRGIPVFDGARLRELKIRVRGHRARAVATISVTFADRGAPSVEDDVIYLERRAGNWIVAKPSATLYRAIGAEVPPAAIAPPR